MAALTLTAHPSGPLQGQARAPGDKSISHRALILGAMAQGRSEIEGLLESDDVLRTADACADLGAHVSRHGGGRWTVEGQGRFIEPMEIVDCGNSGTGVRLLMGAAAGYPICVEFTGDSSLQTRPMGRVLDPLAMMGARVEGATTGKLPLKLHGGNLKAIAYRLPMASAQVKSALLLAGLNAEGGVEVVEPEATRDHTERMLTAFGAHLEITPEGRGKRIRLAGGQTLHGSHVIVPGDPSSAAFLVVAGLIVPGSQVRVDGVLLNPGRAGLYDTLIEMGADLQILNRREESGEPVGDLVARHGPLKGVEVPAGRAPSMIDEYPILAVAAAFAEGPTVMRGIGEMRVKESDRIALMAAGLEACGADVAEEPEGMIVTGNGGQPRGGAMVETHGDHRIAMAHLILGLGAQNRVTVDEPGMIATSFPTFRDLMAGLGARITEA
ncbi:MAG TPA: 3-phosphoshikimate 1-carboxyvinyltransferase [Caulobacteraceae bacterium]|jgi:3-phosphoshikimate 1-carboxyvinyltransferase